MRKLSTWIGLALVVGMGFGGASCTTKAPDPVIAPQAGTSGTLTPGLAGTGPAGTGPGPVGGAGVGNVAGRASGGVGATAGSGAVAGTSAPAAGSGGQKAGTGGSAAGSGGAVAAGTGGTAGMATGGSGGASPIDMCVANAATRGSTGVCPQCACTKCLDKLTNCQDDACVSVVKCGETSGCKGRACYCGNQDVLTCLLGATGPCMMEIAKAAGVCDASSLNTCALALSNVTDPTNAMYNANNPVSRANQVSICSRGQAFEAAGITPELPAIMGMCETECAK